MGLESRMVILAAQYREMGDLGGTVAFVGSSAVPCAMGADTTALKRAGTTDGFMLDKTRKITVRTDLLKGMARQPQSADTVTLTMNLDKTLVKMQISDINGVQSCNGILTVIELYSPPA